jgi:hypothetical protein
MQTPGINRLVRITAIGLCGLGLLNRSIAAPLPGPVTPNPARTNSALSRFDVRGTAAPLDLRVPHDPVMPEFRAGTAAIAIGSFASGIRHSVRGLVDSGINDRGTPSGLNISEADFHVASPAERFVSRVRHEGLPVARLWKSESALLSIGLNQRGKPGVWFTKAIH